MLLVGMGKEVELRDDPSGLRGRTGGKTLALLRPQVYTFLCHLRLCREEKTKESRGIQKMPSDLSPPSRQPGVETPQTEWPKEPLESQRLCFLQALQPHIWIKIFHNWDEWQIWGEKKNTMELPARADFPVMEDGNNKTKDRFLPSRNSLIAPARDTKFKANILLFFHCLEIKKKENLVIILSPPPSLPLSLSCLILPEATFFSSIHEWLVMDLLVPGSEERAQ